jgi:hypothetical protein
MSHYTQSRIVTKKKKKERKRKFNPKVHLEAQKAVNS